MSALEATESRSERGAQIALFPILRPPSIILDIEDLITTACKLKMNRSGRNNNVAVLEG